MGLFEREFIGEEGAAEEERITSPAPRRMAFLLSFGFLAERRGYKEEFESFANV